MAHCGLHHTFDENGNEGAGDKGWWSSPSSSHTWAPRARNRSRPTPVLLHIIRGDAQVNARRQCEGCDDDDYDCSHYTPDKTVTLSPTHTIVLEDGKLWRRCQMIIQKNWMFITHICKLYPCYQAIISIFIITSLTSSWFCLYPHQHHHDQPNMFVTHMPHKVCHCRFKDTSLQGHHSQRNHQHCWGRCYVMS